jgi:hypothetical protein
MKGSPEDPMTEAEVFEKFRSCLAWGFHASEGRAMALREYVMRIDQSADAGELIQMFRDCQAQHVSA